MAEAVNYTLNQWNELNVFATDGAVPIDNNVSEREMKRIVLNRKNTLFVGNERGGADGGDPVEPDQHLQAARDRSAALPDAIADEPADYADQPDRAVAARPVEASKSAPSG